ncbi:MAG: DUF309 domain-containing protein [Sulfuricurvum sp.]|nr:DUF309 domain-containing protein [Sulfuricurvum sp.]
MAQELADINKACEAFILSITEGRYYDAHEDLEGIWHPKRFDNNDEVRLWKGFINASVSFELLKRGRPKPAENVWMTYLKYRELLESIDSVHYLTYVKIVKIIEKKREFILQKG